jgi:hypothetical protein
MPKNLNPYTKPQGGFVTTWTVTATDDAGEAVVCTKADEAGKTHFITFIVCNTDNTDPGGSLVVTLWDGAIDGTGKTLEVWPVEQDGTPSIMNFSSPIQLTEGNAVNLKGIPDGDDKCSLTIGGFTSDTRVD